jgi:hypothetical protein
MIYNWNFLVEVALDTSLVGSQAGAADFDQEEEVLGGVCQRDAYAYLDLDLCWFEVA